MEVLHDEQMKLDDDRRPDHQPALQSTPPKTARQACSTSADPKQSMGKIVSPHKEKRNPVSPTRVHVTTVGMTVMCAGLHIFTLQSAAEAGRVKSHSGTA